MCTGANHLCISLLIMLFFCFVLLFPPTLSLLRLLTPALAEFNLNGHLKIICLLPCLALRAVTDCSIQAFQRFPVKVSTQGLQAL